MTMTEKRQQAISHLNACLPEGIEIMKTDEETNQYVELVEGKKRIPFIILFPDDTGCYMKLPNKWISKYRSYMEILDKKRFHFLLVRDRQYSFPVPMSTAMKHWAPEMATSKGNENRLQFHGSVSKITYHDLKQKDLFGASVIESLIGLLDLQK